jgi:hypothetical protein
MEQSTLWPLALQALQALGLYYGPAMDDAAAGFGLPSPEWYGWLLPALILEPEPISTAALSVRAAYTAPGIIDERLVTAAAQGFLTPVSETEYRLTEPARVVARGVIDAAYATMAALEPIPPDELERLAALLGRLVESSLAAPEPPGRWCITWSRRSDPGGATPLVQRIDQYLSDLGAYRDDAHLAAWQPLTVDGRAWETLTVIWRGDAATLDDLAQKLSRHGYSRAEYGEAVDDLVARRWLTEAAGAYRVTSAGHDVRQAAEDLTDDYFYAPWSCLDEDELAQLQDLLISFRDALRRPAPGPDEPV